MPVEDRREGQAEDEGREHGVALGALGEEHQHQEGRHGALDLGLDHAVAVAPEEPRLEPDHQPDEEDRHAEEGDQPPGRPDEQHGQRERGAEVGDERGGHEELADRRMGQAGLDQHRVDDGQRGRRERHARDLGRRPRPAERPGGEGPGAEEGREEGHAADEQALLEPLPQHLVVDLGAGQEGQEDAGEGREEVHPGRAREPEDVPGDDAHGDLDQGHRDARFDRDHARQQDEDRGDHCDPEALHVSLLRPSARRCGGSGRLGPKKRPHRTNR